MAKRIRPQPDKPIMIVTNTINTINTLEDVATTTNGETFIRDCYQIYKLYKDNTNPTSHKTFCGIDIEYNMNWKLKKRYIAFVQIIMIFDSDHYLDPSIIKPVYIFDPFKLNTNHLKLFIKYILCSGVIKIFHGSDSLDYPHIFNDILNNNKTHFIKFINTSVDTRFLCELSKRFMSRIEKGNIDKPGRCSLYHAMFNNNVIDSDLFERLEEMGSKINYNKLWLVHQLTLEQLIYAAFDVYYLYDLLYELSNRMSSVPLPQEIVHFKGDKTNDPNHNININTTLNIDVVSLVNRLYRFHMINRLGLSNVTEQCKKLVQDQSNTNTNIANLDQKIMDTKLCTVRYTHNNTSTDLDTYLEDVLSIDTIRKSIMYVLRAARIDPASVNKLVSESNDDAFRHMKGHSTILSLIHMIEPGSIDIKCNPNLLVPKPNK